MAPRSGEILSLSATVRTERGRKILRRGDALPEDTLPGEDERLEELGVYGVREEKPKDLRDEAQILADDLAAQVAEEEAVVEEGEEETEDDGDEPEPNDDLEPEEDRVGLAAYLQTATVDEVLARVEGEPDVAPILLELECEADDPRKTLVAGLEAVVEEGEEE